MDDDDKIKKKKVYDRKTAMQKAMQYCAYQERSQQEVRDKLYEWGLHKEDVEGIIADLIEQNFINEERFAILFAGSKFRQKHWGRVKIKQELKLKKISPYCIKKALEEIDDREYLKVLTTIIKKKSEEVKEKNKYKKFAKVASFAISKGYETELVRDILKYEEEE